MQLSRRNLFVRLALIGALTGCNTPMSTPDACATCGNDAGSGTMDSGGGNDAGSSTDAGGATGDATVPPDGGAGVDPHWGERQVCTFAAGAHPSDTLGDLTGARAAIQHVIVIMQENRSMDHMFGHTAIPGIENVPSTYMNPVTGGSPVAPYHLTTPCVTDIPHQWQNIHHEWDNGAMDGFMNYDGMNAMGYYDDSDHPFYTWMLGTFATSDRYFCDVLSGTWPNREYLYAGTSNGIMSTGLSVNWTAPTLFDSLDAHSPPVTWGDYWNMAATDGCLEGSLGGATSSFCTKPSVHPNTDLPALLAAGTAVPSVVFVDFEPFDEHPPEDFRVGEGLVHDLLLQIFASPIWPHTAVFFTYDESGGFFDHVPPPPACLAAPSQAMFNNYGIRVPVAVVSPYARPAYVSHLTHSHASILRFIEAVFDVPALTGRDANSDAMLDMFDFSSPHFATAPAAGTVPAALAHDTTCPM
jgi:phospholipase C